MSKKPRKDVDPLDSAFNADGADTPPPAPVEAPKQHVTVTAHALVRVKGEGWSSVEYTIRGKEIIAVKASNPDVKVVALGKYKQNVAMRMAQSGDDEAS